LPPIVSTQAKEIQMNRQSIKAALLAAGAGVLVSAVAIIVQAQPASPPAPNAAGNDMPMHRGMMGADGPMGGGSMMGMMGQCRQMMGGGAAAFSLPPGNEKLEAQMRAEMLQKTGEIAAKYADRIKEAR
jgi:hypothetical protein